MKLHNDQPIKDINSDMLNRGSFAKNLAMNINEYAYSDALVVGLMGKWGAGKTSILNMMKQEIDEDKVTLIDFNPWYFSGTSELISIFFEVLAQRINYKSTGQQMGELASDIRKYAKVLKLLKLIPGMKDVTELLEDGADKVSEVVEGVADQESNNLLVLKEKINTELQSCKKVVVIIDEIDRLEEAEIKQIFQLVRAVGDFNNVIYVLSFSEEQVLKVVDKEYLDKIINIPLYVPQVSLKYINTFFRKEIDKLFVNKGQVDINYWENAYIYFFKDKFYNLRELNRFLNIIRFNMNYIVKELNAIDYMVLTYLKLFEEEIYNYIRDNKERCLIGVDFKEISGLKTKRIENKADVFKILFDKNKKLRGINNRLYIEAYFTQEISDNILSIDVIRQMQQVKDMKKIQNIFENEEKRIKVIDNFDEVLSGMDDETKAMYINVIWHNLEKIESDSTCLSLEKYQCIEAIKMIVENIEDYHNITAVLEECNIHKNITIKEQISLLKYICNKDEALLLPIIIKNIETYISETGITRQLVENLEELKDIGIDTAKYIKEWIEAPLGLIEFLRSRITLVDAGDYPIYNDNNEVICIEPIQHEKLIIKEDITDYIEWEYVQDKVEALLPEIKPEDKNVINLFKNAITQEEYENKYGNF